VGDKVVNTKHVANPDDVSFPDGGVYVGWRQWGKILIPASLFANYYNVRKYGPEEALSRYEETLRSRPDLMALLLELEGKTLGCWCAGEEGPPKVLTAADNLFCHDQVLLRLLRETA
jgi:hypothetical protein